MGKKITIAIISSLLMLGCSQGKKIKKQEQINTTTYEVKPSIGPGTQTLEEALKTCRQVFPDAENAKDNGDLNFSVSNRVNVLATTKSGEVICSINQITGIVEMVHDGHGAMDANYYIQRKAARLAKEKAIAEDVRRIKSGDHGFFVKSSKKIVADRFKDPDSVRFRDLYISNQQIPTLCGELNAKNGYGGYVGYRSFLFNSDSGYVDSKDDSQEFVANFKKFCSSSFVKIN